MYKLLAAISLTLLVSGCATTALVPIEYQEPVSTESFQTVSIELQSGAVIGYSGTNAAYAGGILIPLVTGPRPENQFGPADQQTFVDSLASELLRLNLARSVDKRPASSDLSLVINFVQTEHFPNNNEYKLTVYVSMAKGRASTDKIYNILSSEGESFWRGAFTGVGAGKIKAANKLMSAMIKDIEMFSSGNL